MSHHEEMQKTILQYLSSFGIRYHSAGRRYLWTGLEVALEHPEYLDEMMERFYPVVAERHDRSVGAVESAMRRAIVDAYNSGVAKDSFARYFKRSAKEIPSVSEFISVITLHIKYDFAIQADAQKAVSCLQKQR